MQKIKKIIQKILLLASKVIFLFGAPGRFLSKNLDAFIKAPDKIKISMYAYWFDTLKIKPSTVLYESYYGDGMRGNCYAIFKELLTDPDYKEFKHVWVINDRTYFRPITEQFSQHKNIKYVRVNSFKYFWYLASAKYLFNDHVFASFFSRRKEQVYVNTWHGTPLKHLGYAKPSFWEGARMNSNTQRNFLASSYIVHENRYTTDVWLQDYRLRDVYEGGFIEEGYPRADLTLKTDKATMVKRLQEQGVFVNANQKVVLYCPTFRGNFSSPKDTMETIKREYLEILANLPDPEAVLLLKVHPALYKEHVKNNPEYRALCVPDFFDSNEILSIVDILITDYSSIFIDFMTTKKPIIFYMQDLEQYQENRGLYMSVDTLPGPICTDLAQVVVALNNVAKNRPLYQKNYDYLFDLWCANNDGQSAARVVDIVFNEKSQHQAHRFPTNQKKKLLFYAGTMATNATTRSLLNLLHNIDRELYDISLFAEYPMPRTKESIKSNMAKVPSDVRFLFRQGRYFFTFFDHLRSNYLETKPHPQLDFSIFDKINFQREARRIFADIEFDHVIDFDGSKFKATGMITSFLNTPKTLFHHEIIDENSLLAAPTRINNLQLSVLFNQIVTTSEHTQTVNKGYIDKYAPDVDWVVVKNTLNLVEIAENSVETERTVMYIYNGEKMFIKNATETQMSYSINAVKLPTPENHNFVICDSFSRLEDYERIFVAFELVVSRYEHARLYLIGQGLAKKSLQVSILEKRLQNHILFVGALNNPFLFFAHCDALILTCNRAGQLITAMEGMAMGLPVISPKSPVVFELLAKTPCSFAYDESPESLVALVEEFIEERPIKGKWDAHEYNRMALQSFYNVLGIGLVCQT